MKVIIKKFYFFDSKEKTRLKVYLAKNNMGYRDFSAKLGISLALLSAIANGNRALTEKIAKKFEENGFKVSV